MAIHLLWPSVSSSPILGGVPFNCTVANNKRVGLFNVINNSAGNVWQCFLLIVLRDIYNNYELVIIVNGKNNQMSLNKLLSLQMHLTYLCWAGASIYSFFQCSFCAWGRWFWASNHVQHKCGKLKSPLKCVGKVCQDLIKNNDTNDLQDERKRSFKRSTLPGIGQVCLWNAFVTVCYKMHD